MAKNRYSDTPVIDRKYYGSFSIPSSAAGYSNLDLLDGVRTFDYSYKPSDRLDKLAAKYYNDENLWWVIAIINNIFFPFSSGGLIAGKTLKIPYNANDVTNKLMR